MKLSDIVYPITKLNVEIAISIYHRKIFFSNGHRIPKDRPVFFVSNHPTAFLEPVIYAGLLDKPIHPLVRGDFFQNTASKTGLESLNMIPIYRMRDGGVEGLRKNAETFQYCYDLLADNRQVLIMAEGFTKQQKRLSPLQKGAARIALGAAQGRNLEDLLIIPLGASFTSANAFRGEVMIEVGEPMEIGDYLIEYKEDKKSAIDRLTLDMEIAMRKTIIHIEHKKDDALFEKVIPIARRQMESTLWPSWVRNEDRFRLEKNWANLINNLSDIDKVSLWDHASDYPGKIDRRSDRNLINWIVLIIGLPIWIVGWVYRGIPFSMAQRIVDRKVEEKEFESPVRLGMGMLFTLIWILLTGFFVVLVGGLKWTWLPFMMMLVIWFSVIFKDVWEVVQHRMNWNKLSDSAKAKAMSIENDLKTMI